MLTDKHRLSFGTSNLAGMYKPVTPEEVHDVLTTAWDAGIRFFDTAPHYGNGMAEHQIGAFLRDKSDWVLSTKVGRLLSPDPTPPAVVNGFHNPLPFQQRYDFTYDGIRRSFEDSLQRLGLNHVDILFLHDLGDPGAGTDTPEHRQQFLDGGGHRALSDLKAEGHVRAVGLGVNTVEICEELIGKVELDLILLAGRYTLLDHVAGQRLFPLCDRHGVRLVIGGVFNSGILATGAVPGAHFNYAPAPEPVLTRVREIEAICQRHEVPMAAAALQYPDRHPLVMSTLIGTSRATSLSRNLTQFRQPLPDALWADLDALPPLAGPL